MGIAKRINKNSTPAEQPNSQVTAQPLSGDTSPVEISQEEETEIPQFTKDFAKKCKDNFKEGTLDRLIGFTWISLLFYISHIGCNIYWLYYFHTKGDSWYFRCTLAFWFISAVMMALKSFLFYNPGWPAKQSEGPRNDLPEKESDFSFAIKWVLGLFCPIPRYWDTIKYARKAKKAKKTDDEKQYMYFVAMIWEDAELLQLRQFDSFMESAPQLLLNLYIAIKEESLFGYSSIFKIVAIGSLSWALVSYDNKICLMNGIKKRDDADQPSRPSSVGIDFTNEDEKNYAIDCIKNINWKKSALSFSAHFSWLVARFMALSLFASVYGWVIWPACLAHLISIFIWHRKKNYGFMDSLRLSFLHVFAYLYPLEKKSDQEKHPRFSPVTYHSICICENLFLMVMWSQSFIKFDEGINLEIILSILSYPWNDWTFFAPWIGQILAFISSFALFWGLNNVRYCGLTMP